MSVTVDAPNGQATLDPGTVAALRKLASRADEIVALVDMIGGGLARGPEIADNVNGLVQIARNAVGTGSDGFSSLGKAVTRLRALVESDAFATIEARLQDPVVATNLGQVLDRAGDLNALVGMLEGMLKRGPEYADNVNGLVQIMRGVKIPLNVPAFLESLGKLDYDGLIALTSTLYGVLSAPQVQQLLKSNILGAQTLALVDGAANAALEAQQEETRSDRKVGAFGALSGLNDPDVQRTVAFALDFAKRFGQVLRSGPALPKS